MIFTSFNSPNANTSMNTRTELKIKLSKVHNNTECVCMPLMYFQPQCYLGSVMELNEPWGE